MTLALDLPPCQPSFVQRMDPRWKLAGLVVAAGSFAILRSVGPALTACVGAVLIVALARISWPWYLRRLGIAMIMYTLFMVWLPFVPQEGHDTLDLGPIAISVSGLHRLIVLTANLAAMLSLMMVLLATTPLPNLFKAARALWLPRLLVFLMLLTYRYVCLLMEEFGRLRIALRVRGFRNAANVHSYRTIGQVAGTLLVRSAERSERVGQAMRCRGFEGEFHTLDEFRTARTDVAIFVLLMAWVAGLVTWDLLVR